MSNRSALIVNADLIEASHLATDLKKLGYEVLATASNMFSAISCAKNLKPEIILIDFELHDSSEGLQVARQILKDINTAIIFLSSLSNEPIIKEALAIGDTGYLLKPVTFEALKTTLEVTVDRLQTNYKKRIEEKNLRLAREMAFLKENLKVSAQNIKTPLKLAQAHLKPQFSDFQDIDWHMIQTSLHEILSATKKIKSLSEEYSEK